jgi:hypothetical protein
MPKKQEIQALETLYNRGCVHVVGRTAYRSAHVSDIIAECERDDVAFIENRLSNKDNHVVIIVQVRWGENGWPEGTYYVFLSDLICLMGKQIIYKEW